MTLVGTAISSDCDRVCAQNPLVCHQLLLIKVRQNLVYFDLLLLHAPRLPDFWRSTSALCTAVHGISWQIPMLAGMLHALLRDTVYHRQQSCAAVNMHVQGEWRQVQI